MIVANTCPYCGAPYGVAEGGCRNDCADMLRHKRLVDAAADSDPGELNEETEASS